MITVVRIYSDTNGESHFEDIKVPLKEAGMVGTLSPEVPVKSLIFREVAPTYDWDFHCAPQRQYIVLLDGEIEIETSLGNKRTFRAGDILLVEDTAGKGHKTRNLERVLRKSLFITLP
jgi:quercetin dioxygenase-like cupin family protein